MGLDPVTIVAQIINFAVLVWLLNRFLYRPVRGMIAAREEKVRRRLEQAEATEARAQEALETYRQLQAQLERERGRLLAEAREAARQEQDRLLEAAAEEAQQARRRFAEALAAERAELAAAFQERLVRHVCDTSGRIVAHLAGVSLADAIIGTLEARWEEAGLSGGAGRPDAPPAPVVVRTSFEPTPEQRARLVALAARVGHGPAGSEADGDAGAGPRVEFRVDPDLLLGVEIEAGGTAIAWTARDILEDLQQQALASLAVPGSPASSAAHEVEAPPRAGGEVTRGA